MARLVFDDQITEMAAGETLLETARRLGIPIASSCGGEGSCQECIVRVTRGEEALSPRAPEEDFLRGGHRLACRCRVERQNVEVRVRSLRRGTARIVTEGRKGAFELDPCARRGPGGTVLLDEAPVGRSAGPILGVAADLGTTTVVLRLVDLESGRIRATHSFENPQVFGGGDVMGRIVYDRQSRGHELQRSLIAAVNQSIDEFAAALGIRHDDIYEFVAAGNTTMRDLFFGLDVQGIGRRPFQSLTEIEYRAGRRPSTAIVDRAARLGVRMNPEGRIFGIPLVACHVGADTAACLAAIAMDQEDRTVLLMDIGTNTELVLGNRRRVMCASCAAGPAFEGGAIACGMPGLEGAIESLRINDTVHYSTIGGAPPLGICGSGLIDALGELRRTGRINLLGRLQAEDGRFWIDRERDLYLCERDISELAQAKAATIAGAIILLERYGISPDRVDRLFLAGAFAQSIDIEHALRIGMIAQIPPEKIEKIGNASIEGATAMLCSNRLRRRIDRFVHDIEHVELEKHPNFFEWFVEGCQFKTSTEMMANMER